MNRTKITILSIAGVSLLLSLVLGYLVWDAWSTKGVNEADLEGYHNDLDSLKRLPVFPCAEGVKAIGENRALYVDWLDEAHTAASTGDRRFEATTPAAFKAQMNDDAHRLGDCPGTQDGKLVKAGFSFGYGELIGGSTLPVEADLPRLQREWFDLVHVIELMADSGVSAVTAVELGKGVSAAVEDPKSSGKGKDKKKDKKDKNKPKKDAAKSAAPAAGDALVSKFDITFMASSAALVKTFNALTADTRFIVIDSYEFVRDRDELNEKLAGKKQEVTKKRGRGRQQEKQEETSVKGTVVIDPQAQADLKVKLSVSVYDFRTAEKSAAPKASEEVAK